MATYRVKKGRKAFVNSALLDGDADGGAEFDMTPPYKVCPDWAEVVSSPSKAHQPSKPVPKAPEPKKFEDVDLTNTTTVQL